MSVKKTKNNKEMRMPGEFEEHMVHIGDGNYRRYFQGAYGFGGRLVDCKGHVKKIEKKRILLDYIYVEFMQHDGSFVDGKEEHVWIYDPAPFAAAGVKDGDKVSFSATVYAYHRKDGSRDYSLKECENVQRINEYELPSDEYLQRQFAENMVCEICLFNKHCYGFCIANKGWKEEIIQLLLKNMKKEV